MVVLNKPVYFFGKLKVLVAELLKAQVITTLFLAKSLDDLT